MTHINWQSIETAPLDGTPIDLWVPLRFGPKVDYRFAGVCWDIKNECWVDYFDGDPVDFCESQPTHWMPLPEGPQ